MLRSLLWQTFVTNVGITALGLANSFLLSRALGPAGRGGVAAAMLWSTLGVYLSSLGVIAATLRQGALPAPRTRPLVATSFALALAQGALAVAVGAPALGWLLSSQGPEVVRAGRWYLLVIPVSLAVQYGVSILQGRMRGASFTWLRAVVPGGYLLGTVGLIVSDHLDLLNIVLLHLLLNVVALVVTLTTLARSGIPVRASPDWGLARQMLRYGAPVHVGTIAALTTMHLDQVLMAAWLPPHDLGLYVVAVSAAGVTHLVAQTVQLAVTPSIMQRSSGAERAGVLQAVFRRYVILSLLLTLVLGALLPVAIPLVFGRAFEGAVRPAEVLLVGAFFFGASIVLAGGAQALGSPWIGSRAQIGGLMATVVLLPLLLPTLGIVGAALASTGAWVTTFAIVTAGLCRTHGIPVTDLVRITSRDVTSLLDVRAVLKARRGQPLLDRQ